MFPPVPHHCLVLSFKPCVSLCPSLHRNLTVLCFSLRVPDEILVLSPCVSFPSLCFLFTSFQFSFYFICSKFWFVFWEVSFYGKVFPAIKAAALSLSSVWLLHPACHSTHLDINTFQSKRTRLMKWLHLKNI